MLADVLIWGGYIALFIWLSRKGSGHDVMVSGRVGFGIQAFAYVATYISAVALVGFGGLAYAYGMQMLLVAAGNVWLGTWIVYRYLAWPACASATCRPARRCSCWPTATAVPCWAAVWP